MENNKEKNPNIVFGLLILLPLFVFFGVYFAAGFISGIDVEGELVPETTQEVEIDTGTDISGLFEEDRRESNRDESEKGSESEVYETGCSLGDLDVKSGTNVSYTVCVGD